MLVILSLVAPNSARPVSAAPTAEQRKQISQIDGMIAKAGNLSRGKKYEEAVELIKQAQANLEKVAASTAATCCHCSTIPIESWNVFTVRWNSKGTNCRSSRNRRR